MEDPRITLIPKQDEIEESNDNGLEALMQKQIAHEFENARLYLAMGLWCHKHDLTETAKFFSGHALEERQHGMDFLNSMLVQGMDVKTPSTPTMYEDYEDLEELLKAAVDREILTSKMIGKLHHLAIKEGSIASDVTQKYMKEQYEEEQLFKSILSLYELHKHKDSLASFDSQMKEIKASGKFKIGEL